MIKIYDRFNNFIKQIDTYKDMKIEKEINKLDLFFFNIPKSLSDLFEEEGYIETKDHGRFIIKEKNLTNDGYEIVGRYDLEEFNDWIESKAYVTETPKEMLEDLLQGKDWTVVSSITTKRTVTATNVSMIALIKQIVDTFNAEVIFDNVDKKIYVEEKLGEDKGVYFTDELNLRRLNISSDTYDFATRIIPRGLNGEGIEQINNGVPYVENHTYSDKIVTVIWEDERYTNMNELKADAEKKLEVLSKPRRAFTCDIANLASVSDEYSILDYNLGDTITLVEKESGTREKQRIIKLVHYPDNPLKDTIDIENRPRKLGDREEQRIENLEGSNSVIKASLELLEDSVVSTVKRLENLVVNADNRLYQSQTNIPFYLNSGEGEIVINRNAFHPYYKVTSNENVDLSINFPLSRYAENLVGKEVTISLDVMTELDSTATIEDKEYNLKANEWSRISYTKTFPDTDTKHIRVRTRYSKKQSRDIKLGDNLIDSLKVDIDTLYYRNLQVQKGDVPTNWTLTPEELEGQINRYESEIKQLADEISLRVTAGELESVITMLSDEISSKVAKGQIISEINQSPEQIKIQAMRILLEGIVTANNNFKILEDGSMEARNAYFEGDIVSNNADIRGKVTATSGKVGGYSISGNNLVGNDVTLGQNEIKIGNAKINNNFLGSIGDNALCLDASRVQFGDGKNTWVIFDNKVVIRHAGDFVTATFGVITPSGGTALDWIGTSSQRWNNIYLVNQPDVSSDVRLKKEIQDIPDDLIEYIKEIKPKMYRQNDKWHFGYIAQDVERAIYKYALNKVGFNDAWNLVKEFAFLAKDESYMSLLYGEIAVLKEKEMQNRIDELEDRIFKLEKIINEK